MDATSIGQGIVISLCVYTLFTFLINGILYYTVNVKLPFSKSYYKKKYGKKVNPIYKLEGKYSYHPGYGVSKYELGWGKRDDRWTDFVFIGASIFQTYGYFRNENMYGSFEKEEIENNTEFLFHPYNNIKDFWEGKKKESEEKYKADLDKRNKFENTLNEINHIFIENYE